MQEVDFETIKNNAYVSSLKQTVAGLVEQVADATAAFKVMLASRDQINAIATAAQERVKVLEGRLAEMVAKYETPPAAANDAAPVAEAVPMVAETAPAQIVEQPTSVLPAPRTGGKRSQPRQRPQL